MPISPRLLRLVALSALLAAASTAQAGKPSKRECASANETAQDLKRAGKLREARVQLAQCTAASCPGPIREDCAQMLAQISAAMPSLVFAARDGAGNDLTSVRVAADGDPLVDKLDGAAVAIDPGEHNLSFEADGYRSATKHILVREGEVGRRVVIVLESLTQRAAPPPAAAVPASEAAASPATDEAPPSYTSRGGTQRAVGIAVGASGLVALGVGGAFAWAAKSTYDHALQDECGGNSNHCTPQGGTDGQTADGQATTATVLVAAGLGLLGGGVALFLTSRSSSDVTVGATITGGGGALAVRGAW